MPTPGHHTGGSGENRTPSRSDFEYRPASPLNQAPSTGALAAEIAARELPPRPLHEVRR